MRIKRADWDKAQRDELTYWMLPQAMTIEANKQFIYFHYMDLPSHDLDGKSILDLGGGMQSYLLNCRNFTGVVVDPILRHCPRWVLDRYLESNITTVELPIEEYQTSTQFDEVWIYNVLQHVLDPEECVAKARMYGKLVRVFEPVNRPADSKHPHVLTKEWLDAMFDADGTVKMIDDNPFYKGESYYGCFKQI